MHKSRHVFINAVSTLLYFSGITAYYWNESGGDIVIWMLFAVVVIIHFIIIAVIYLGFVNGKSFRLGLIGILIGSFICLAAFKGIEYCKYKDVGSGKVEETSL